MNHAAVLHGFDDDVVGPVSLPPPDLVDNLPHLVLVTLDLLDSRGPRHAVVVVLGGPPQHPLDGHLVPGLGEGGVGDAFGDGVIPRIVDGLAGGHGDVLPHRFTVAVHDIPLSLSIGDRGSPLVLAAAVAPVPLLPSRLVPVALHLLDVQDLLAVGAHAVVEADVGEEVLALAGSLEVGGAVRHGVTAIISHLGQFPLRFHVSWRPHPAGTPN